MRAGLHLLYDTNLLTGLDKCKTPVLFLGGTRDRTINPESFTQAAALMPAASARMIRAAGHAPFISHPEQFLESIRGFLNGDQSA